jgi:hypothetical protein
MTRLPKSKRSLSSREQSERSQAEAPKKRKPESQIAPKSLSENARRPKFLKPGEAAFEAMVERVRVTMEQRQKEQGYLEKALKLSEHERWNNLCMAAAEDALLDETPPGNPHDVSRIREHIAHLVASHRRKS